MSLENLLKELKRLKLEKVREINRLFEQHKDLIEAVGRRSEISLQLGSTVYIFDGKHYLIYKDEARRLPLKEEEWEAEFLIQAEIIMKSILEKIEEIVKSEIEVLKYS